jgi:hypothetical protein
VLLRPFSFVWHNFRSRRRSGHSASQSPRFCAFIKAFLLFPHLFSSRKSKQLREKSSSSFQKKPYPLYPQPALIVNEALSFRTGDDTFYAFGYFGDASILLHTLHIE